jgi:chitinase
MQRSAFLAILASTTAVVLAAVAVIVAFGTRSTPEPSADGSTKPMTPSASPSSPVARGASAALPDRTLTGYWQNFRNDAKALRLADVPREYDLVAVAFASATPANDGTVTFAVDETLADAVGGYTDEQFQQDVRTLQQRGQSVIVSVGGQNANVRVDDAASAQKFAASVQGLMSTYGFDGVDIDLEHGIDAEHMADALRTIEASEPGAVITLAPQTLDMQAGSSSYLKLATDIRDILTIVQTQYYNSGSMNGCDGGVHEQGGVDFITAQHCIAREAGLRADQIGVGMPATELAAGSGHIAPAQVVDALTCLESGDGCGVFEPTAAQGGVRGAMTWSINWDASNDYAFAKTVRPALDALD